MGQRTHFTSVKQGELKFLRELPVFKDIGGDRILIYEATELVGFSADNEHLDRYANTLQARLKAQCKEAVIVDFSLVESLPYTSHALQILISLDKKIKYHSVFLTFINSDTESNNLFPLLFVSQSSTTVINMVHKIISKMFSCCIKNYKILKEELLWMTAIGMNELLRRRINEGLLVTYSFPFYSGGIIHSAISEDLVLYLWHKYLYNNENRISLSNLQKMFLDLEQHLFNTYGINFSTFEIKQIKMKGVNITCLSTIELKIVSPEILYIMLLYLHSLIFERKGATFQLE
ncbi:uncharacterized protein LOC106670772 [Cimex lectularius]|uniref:Centromere protein L n=1 Tax=Cimex lectularius TaxID=79782 RepID=A0A8I6S4A1_CIMLE|nr:uncharacterized protein LOC106670772 [Cimex lectularius]